MTQQQVTTEFGPGVIVATQKSRGETSYKVEGINGAEFSLWLTAAQIPEFGGFPLMDNGYHPDQVNYENSTTLPYNPRPQFFPHNGESTIQPNQHLDTQKRLTPADSVTFEDRPEVNRFPNNFARSASVREAAGHFDVEIEENVTFAGQKEYFVYCDGSLVFETRRTGVSALSTAEMIAEKYRNASDYTELDGAVYVESAARSAGVHEALSFEGLPPLRSGDTVQYVEDGRITQDYGTVVEYPVTNPDGNGVDRGFAFVRFDDGEEIVDIDNLVVAGRHTADRDPHPQVDLHYESPVIDEEYPGGTNTPEGHDYGDWNDPGTTASRTADNVGNPVMTFQDFGGGVGTGAPVTDSMNAPMTDETVGDPLSEVQARLGDKYIDIPRDHDFSLQAQLDMDPYQVMADIKASNRELAWTQYGQEDPTILAQVDLEATDPQLRQAAWADVRAKATRLRRSGNVQTDAINPVAIVATVTGDHGIYEVAVIRGSQYQGSSHVSEWSCSCPWGDWAFERQNTYVGRLCSHAYAALQELRAATMRKDKPSQWKSQYASRNVEAADVSREIPRSVMKGMSDSELADLMEQCLQANPGMDLHNTSSYDYPTENFKRAYNTLDKRRGWTAGSEEDRDPAKAVQWARSASRTAASGEDMVGKQVVTDDGDIITVTRYDADTDSVYGENTDPDDYFGKGSEIGPFGKGEWREASTAARTAAAPSWSLWPDWQWTETADGRYAAEIHVWGELGPSGNAGTGAIDWSIIDTSTFLTAETSDRDYSSAAEAQADAQAALAKYGSVTSARHPRPDGRLSTEPGTLEPDLYFVPPSEGHEKRHVDVEVGTPYPQPTVASVNLQSNAFDRYMDYSEGAVGAQEWADYCEYREMVGDPITDAEIQELGPGIAREAFIDDPLVGSGTEQPESYGTSEEYVERHERPHHDENWVAPDGRTIAHVQADVAEQIGVNPDGTDQPNEVRVDDPNEDIIAKFQREAGAHLMSNDAPASGTDDFAGAAQAFLRTAGRHFTEDEQRALMNEAAVDGPIDQSELDLNGTHYLG